MSLDGYWAPSSPWRVTFASGRVHHLGWLSCHVRRGTAWIGILHRSTTLPKHGSDLVRAGPFHVPPGDARRMSWQAIWDRAARIGVPAALSWRPGSACRSPHHRSHRLSFLDLELAPAVVRTDAPCTIPSGRSLWHSRPFTPRSSPLDSLQFNRLLRDKNTRSCCGKAARSSPETPTGRSRNQNQGYFSAKQSQGSRTGKQRQNPDRPEVFLLAVHSYPELSSTAAVSFEQHFLSLAAARSRN